MPAKIDDPAPFVNLMKPALDRATALLGGTDAMRAAGTDFLPKFPGEHQEVYNWRLKVAVLNNFYDAMAAQMVGKLFEKPLTWVRQSKIDKAILDNIDKRGSSLDTFAGELAKALLTKGRPHILIDHPKKPEEAQTAADDQAHGLRPYWVQLEPGCVISAWADTESGEERLGYFSWREWANKLDGYGIKSLERIRIFKRNEAGQIEFEVWERERDTDQFELAEQGELRPGGSGAMKEIPLVTLYSDRQSFMVAKPTLDDIAHKNIEHWQSSADQRHILTVSRFPILYQFGTKNPVALVGPYSMFHADASKQDAEIGYAEAEGKGTEHGWKDLDRILKEAESMAIRIMISDAAKTDAGEKTDWAKEGSRLQKLAFEVERAINQALIHTARWQGLPDEAAGVVQTNKDFGISSDDAKAIEQLLAMREKGDLSQPTLWREAIERRLFRTKFDPKKEAELIEDEKQRNLEAAMAAGFGGAGPGAEDDDDEGEGAPPKKPAAAAA